jgi:hypothetical protein
MQTHTSHEDSGARRRGDIRGLLALNAALLAVLAAVTFGSSADAQFRARGNYTMVAGNVKGSNTAAIFVVDTTNQELVAARYDRTNLQLVGVGYRNLAADAAGGFRAR